MTKNELIDQLIAHLEKFRDGAVEAKDFDHKQVWACGRCTQWANDLKVTIPEHHWSCPKGEV